MRLATPQPVEGSIVIWVAALGIVVNGASAWLFFAGRKSDLNIRGAFLHLAADAGISLGVVAAGVAIVWSGKLWIDPITSLVIVATILYGTWDLLKDSLNLALHAVPGHINRDSVETFLRAQPGVTGIHDLHIWAMSTTQVALTVHLVMSPAQVDDVFLARTTHELEHEFGIEHATIQIETGNGPKCCLAADERV
jgi:cobalt-zinc-cadmium efflux system protein